MVILLSGWRRVMVGRGLWIRIHTNVVARWCATHVYDLATASGLRYPVRCGSRWLKSSLINLVKEAEGFMSLVKSGVQLVGESGDGG